MQVCMMRSEARSLRISNTVCGRRSSDGYRSDDSERRRPGYQSTHAAQPCTSAVTSTYLKFNQMSVDLPISLKASFSFEAKNPHTDPTPGYHSHNQCTFLLPPTGSFWH